MSTPTATPPAPTTKPNPPKAVVVKPIEVGDLIANPEGVVSIKPKDVAPTQHCTVVNGRTFLGYGGPLAVNDIEGRGTFKALADDGLYELSDGGQYVLPANLAEALGIVLPPPAAIEVAAMAGKLDEYEAEQKAKSDKEAAAKAKASTPPAKLE